MSKKLKAIEARQIDINTEVFSKTEAQAKEWSAKENESEDIGLHRDIGFLIELGLCALDSTPTSNEEVKNILSNSLNVLCRLKRGAAFKLGSMTLLANRFGVMTFVTRCDHFKGYGSMHTVRCQPILHELLGTITDGYDGRDALYNYSIQ